MLSINYEYSNKSFEIEPYTTAQEREILLLDLLGSTDKINAALKILKVSNETLASLSDDEKLAMLLKFRSVSIGDEIPIKYKCKHCDIPNEVGLNIDGLVTDSDIKNPIITDQFKEVTENNLGDFLSIDIDELDLDEYDTILDEVQNSVTKFNFTRINNCIKCREPNYINVKENVMDYMSEDSLTSMYQTYNDLSFFGKYTKQDIDTLYPFERVILIGLLNKTREELNK